MTTNLKKHDFYFPADFPWERPLFNQRALTTELFVRVYYEVEWWVRVHTKETDVSRSNSFNFVADRTYWHIDVECKFGVFVYHWLNEFVREVGYFVWRYTYAVEKAEGLDDKKAMKLADQNQAAYEKWAREEFA